MAGLRFKYFLPVVWLLLVTAEAMPPNRQAATDAYCRQLRLEFQGTVPYFFSGPNPWVEVPELPPEFLDEAVAAAYMEGTRIDWVVIDLAGAGGKGDSAGWYQRVNYYFDQDGRIIKRERHFEQTAANTAVDEVRYYSKGRPWKIQTVHHALANGPEDWSQLFDPDAPEYLSTGELPFPKISVAPQRLARRFR